MQRKIEVPTSQAIPNIIVVGLMSIKNFEKLERISKNVITLQDDKKNEQLKNETKKLLNEFVNIPAPMNVLIGLKESLNNAGMIDIWPCNLN